jgi:DNA modification methylase
MTPPRNTILTGDVRRVLPTLPSDSIDCVVTSPPYWGLRDYGTGTWEGGDPGCPHRVGSQVADTKAKGAITAGVRPGVDTATCRDCGAVRVDAQLGLEPTPAEYIRRMVDVFREVRRVLAPHGTLWLNMGDSYVSTAGAWRPIAASGKNYDVLNASSGSGLRARGEDRPFGREQRGALKPKDLVGLPWRVAFALQADGWYLRSDVVWTKPNPMPESVRDRPTKAHEYVFLLTKRSRYHFDQEAVREPHVPDGRQATTLTVGSASHPNHASRAGRERWPNGGRNIRSVWEIATQPFPGAHFATFPEAFVRRCLLAGCPERVCRVCGRPRKRLIERRETGWDGSRYAERSLRASGGVKGGGIARSTLGSSGGKGVAARETTGWSDCGHGAYRPGLVLDPFFGAGTTGVVAEHLGRDWLGVELSPSYVALARRRLEAARAGRTRGGTARRPQGGRSARSGRTGAGRAASGRSTRAPNRR